MSTPSPLVDPPRAIALFPALTRADPRLSLHVGDQRLAGPQLLAALAAYQHWLAANAIHPGARVAVWATGHLAAALALLGNAALGVLTVPLGPKLGARELHHILGDAAPTHVLAADTSAPELRGWSRPEPLLQLPLIDLSEQTDRPVAPFDPPALPPHTPLLILYTSGTTGAPKGAVITLGNVASDLDALALAWQWSAADTVVHALPLFHVHGLVLGLYGALRVGGGLHWLPRFEPHALAAALAAAPSAVLFAVPTLFARLADEAERPDLPPDQRRSFITNLRSARLLVSGSAALSQRDHQRIHQQLGRGVYERYGLTETLINCAIPVTQPPEPGRVGPPLPGVELRLVDDERRPLSVLDDQTIGEIAVRGPNVFAGYLHRPDATAAVLDAEGWFYTGDLATQRVDGSIKIVGRRATDLIKSGGFKIGAGEIEALLQEHPAVAEAAVLGAPDPDLGESIVAFLVLRPGAREPTLHELAEWVTAQLAPHKRPRALYFLGELPRTPLGKVQKKLLAQRL